MGIQDMFAFLQKFIQFIPLKRKRRFIWGIVYKHGVLHNQVHLFLCASIAHCVQVVQFG